MRWSITLLVALGCKSKKLDEPMPEPPLVPDAAVVAPPGDAPKGWPELEGFTRVQPERVISLPAKPDMPKFALGGPALLGDIAIVSSSQFGFVAANWRTGAIAWTKPAGSQVAPPVVVDDDIVLMGDCVKPPAVADREVLAGCLRVVTRGGTDRTYVAIRGKPRALEPFLAERGDQQTSRVDDHTVRWQRGEHAITVDLITGVAKPADPTPPPLAIVWKERRWDVAHVDGRVVAYKGGTKQIAWQTENTYSRILGPVWLTEMGPMLRVANASSRFPDINLIDMDATGSLRAQVAKPTPGIAVLADAVSSIGDAALAVRLDSSLRRDFVVGYAANALLMYVWPLPEHQRVDRVGIAISEEADAVVVFHDGDTLTVLPELSAPPTSLGATRAASKKPTP